jgi:pantothenate kinase-related protein Tda10
MHTYRPQRELSLYEFSQIINDGSLNWKNLPFEVTIEEGWVVGIEEIEMASSL